MAQFRLGLLAVAVWLLSCTETTTVETPAGEEEPAPTDAPGDVPGDDPDIDDPSTEPPGDPSPAQGSGGMAGSGGGPAPEPPRSDVIEVDDGSFNPGQPPAPVGEASLAQIVSLVGPAAVTNGGSAILHVQLSAPVPSPSFVIALNGDTGYHTVTGTDADGDGVYDITTVVAAGATQTSLLFRVALSNAGNVGAYREIEIPVIQSGTGDVKITLSWDRVHDLDLRVTEPNGEVIRYSNQSSGTGGELDLDSGANCGASAANSENIFWPTGGGPSGQYVVSVHNYQQCSAGPIDYTVRVVYDSTVRTYRGTFAEGSAAETETADNLREVARFSR